MRHGYESRLLTNEHGQLVAFATGADFTAEHEQGSRPLQDALTLEVSLEALVLQDLRAGRTPRYPSLEERKRIVRNVEAVQFIEVPGTGTEPPQALLGYAREALHVYKNELPFPTFSRKGEERDVTGAWDTRSFAIRVRGDDKVAALREFHEALKAGKVAFAGTFMPDSPRLRGVVLARLDLLSDSTRESMAPAQREYESKMRLKARDDSTELTREMLKVCGRPSAHFGFLWAAWKDAEESEVVYRLNPGYGIKAQYGGPYTRQQLLDWAAAGFEHELRPETAAA